MREVAASPRRAIAVANFLPMSSPPARLRMCRSGTWRSVESERQLRAGRRSPAPTAGRACLFENMTLRGDGRHGTLRVRAATPMRTRGARWPGVRGPRARFLSSTDRGALRSPLGRSADRGRGGLRATIARWVRSRSVRRPRHCRSRWSRMPPVSVSCRRRLRCRRCRGRGSPRASRSLSPRPGRGSHRAVAHPKGGRGSSRWVSPRRSRDSATRRGAPRCGSPMRCRPSGKGATS